MRRAENTELTRYRARWIVETPDLVHEDAELLVQGGRVRGLRRRGPGTPDVDFGSALILPGFVNAHTHLDLTLCETARNYARRSAEPDFWRWVRHVVAYRRSVDQDELCRAVQAGVEQSIAAGVVAVGDITTVGLPLDCWQPLRGVVFGEVLGLEPAREQAILQRARLWLADAPAESAVRASLAPHAPYSASPDLFRQCVDLVRGRGLPLATHLAETAEEMGLCRPARTGGLDLSGGNGRRFHPSARPLIELLRELGAWFPERLSLIPDVLRLISTAGMSWVVAHGNYLNSQDWRTLRNWAALVYCPSTHLRFRRPPHPFEQMVTDGLEVAIGTDSLASANSLSVLDEARLVHRGGTRWPPSTLLAAITRVPARALGLHHHGTLEPGCAADFCVVRLPDGDGDPLHALFESDSPVCATVIGGQPVYWA